MQEFPITANHKCCGKSTKKKEVKDEQKEPGDGYGNQKETYPEYLAESRNASE
jgi:hypothetical protein